MPFYDSFLLARPTALGTFLADQESRNCLKAIIKQKRNVRSFLEIGPGRGAFAASCLAYSFDYTCADISVSLLRDLSQIEKKVRILAPVLPFRTESFDVTYAANLLEHMIDFRAALLFIEEMRRVVRPGGLVCHRVPNAMAWGFHFWNGDYTHSFFTTPRTVAQLYLDASLKIKAVYPVSGFVVGPFARPLSLFGKMIPSWIVDHGADPASKFAKSLYSAKTSFLLGLIIIGQK
jgi:SAM-dependent methyltransferase